MNLVDLEGSSFLYPTSKLSEEVREQLVCLFEEGYGCRAAASLLDVQAKRAETLYERWRLHGRMCLMTKRTKTYYSFEQKLEIVERFKQGESAQYLASEYGLSSRDLVKSWVRTYDKEGEEGLSPKRKGRPGGAKSSVPKSDSELKDERIRMLEAEVAYLKKLRDLRRQQR